jgi:hypothetical protein
MMIGDSVSAEEPVNGETKTISKSQVAAARAEALR